MKGQQICLFEIPSIVTAYFPTDPPKTNSKKRLFGFGKIPYQLKKTWLTGKAINKKKYKIHY